MMKKLFRVLTLLLLISFISPFGYSSEIVRVKNIKSDKPIYRPTITEVLKLINEEGDQEYWYGSYFNNEKKGDEIQKLITHVQLYVHNKKSLKI